MKSQTRIALYFFIGMLCVILALSVSVYFFSTRYAFNDFYARMELRTKINARLAVDTNRNDAVYLREWRERDLERLSSEHFYIAQAEDTDSLHRIVASLHLPIDFFSGMKTDEVRRHRDGQDFYTAISFHFQQGEFIGVLRAENYYYTHHLKHLRTIFLIALPIGFLLSLYIAFFISRKVFKPVSMITGQVKKVSSERMHLRLDMMADDPEINELIRTFNDLLDRLETAFESQNNFISNASHELKNPLTSIVGEIEVSLSRDRSREEYRESLVVVQKEAERLQDITKSLLFLAQTAFRADAAYFEIIRVDQIIWDIQELQNKINPHNQIRIDLSLMPEQPEKLKVAGNYQLLLLALSNIVHNACKYSNNDVVNIAVASSQYDVVVVVKDNGIGIPAEELKFIYDPFFRASNTLKYEGFGIGLPLARNIIRLHHGTLEVRSEANSGTSVKINLPIARIRQSSF